MMRVLFYKLIICVLVLNSQLAHSTEEQKLTELMDAIWQFEMQSFPTFATSRGVHDYDDKLTDMSPAAIAQRHQQFSAFLAQLQNINKPALPRTAQINLLMQIYRTKNIVDGYKFNSHYVPLTSEYGFHSSIAGLPRSVKFRNLKDYQN